MVTVSVLCPSRGRPDLLAASLRSLGADDPAVEVWVAADDDDPGTVDVALSYAATVIVSPRRGYHRLHGYYNSMAAQAAGDWLLLWNDDAQMITDGWVGLLTAVPDGMLVADLRSQLSPGLCCFPAVRREAVRAVGGFSPHTPHCDTYWQDMGRALGRIQAVPIDVHHDRYDLTGNNADRTWQEGQSGYRSSEYYSPPIQAAIAADIRILETLYE